MLNEKKLMENKLLTLVFITVMSGFLLGVGCCLGIITLVARNIPGVMAAIVVIIATFILAAIGDKVRNQIKDFINSPYYPEDENDQQNKQNSTVLDPSAD